MPVGVGVAGEFTTADDGPATDEVVGQRGCAEGGAIQLGEEDTGVVHPGQTQHLSPTFIVLTTEVDGASVVG